MEFAVFLFLMACLTAVQGYWIYILSGLLAFSLLGSLHACSCGTCPKRGAWSGLKLSLLIFALLIPLGVTVLMAGTW